MKNNPNEIHFDCPKCKRPMSCDKALLLEFIKCPDCGEAFIPTPRKVVDNSVDTCAEKIHKHADRFTAAAAILSVLGLFIATASLAQTISGEGAGSWFIVQWHSLVYPFGFTS